MRTRSKSWPRPTSISAGGAGSPRKVSSYLEAWPALDAPERRAALYRAEFLARATYSSAPPTRAEFVAGCGEDSAAAEEQRVLAEAGERRQQESFAGGGRFFVYQTLGKGGMGTVYGARDRELGISIALKTLPQPAGVSLYRFKHEFRALADLDHSNLVNLYELFSNGEQWFYSMELVDGVDFARYMARPLAPVSRESDEPTQDMPGSPPQPLDAPASVSGAAQFAVPDPSDAGLQAAREQRLRGLLAQLAGAIRFLHQHRKLHRDLKPANVLVRPDGHVVVLDFGLVKELGRAEPDPPVDSDPSRPAPVEFTSHNYLLGTVHYMAPEQSLRQPLSEASDWYAFGVLMYQGLTERLPFAGEMREVLAAKQNLSPPPVTDFAPHASPELVALCARLLARAPEDRPTGDEIIAVLGSAPHDAPAVEREAGFVGRSAELGQLLAALDEIEAAGVRIVRLHGRSGEGKTALLDAFLERAAARAGVAPLVGRCYEQESVPYKSLDALVDSLVHHLLSLDTAALEASLPRHISALAQMFPVLRRLDPVEAACETSQTALDPQSQRRQAHEAFAELVDRLASRTPLVLALDDLQWGDADSAALLIQFLSRRAPRVLIVMAYRSEQTSPFLAALDAFQARSDPARWREVRLGPLAPREARELACEILDIAPDTDDQRLERLVSESQGSPYLLFELARMAAAGTRAGDRWGGIDEVLWARIEQLPAAARQLLQMVAVASQPVSRRSACLAAEMAALDPATLTRLRRERLLRAAGPSATDELEAYHDRIRECVLARLDGSTRERCHRRLADTFVVYHDAGAETIGVHFEGANCPRQAAEHYLEAARESSKALAFERAARLFERAWRLRSWDESRGRQLRKDWAASLASAGCGQQAADIYRDLAGDEDPPTAWSLECRRLAASQYCVSGAFREGFQMFDDLLRHADLRLPKGDRWGLAKVALARARLRLRGLGFKARSAGAIWPNQLRRIDLLWAVTAGLSVPDALRVATIHTEGLLRSLSVGEPYRIARALAWEAAIIGLRGSKSAGRSASLLDSAQQIANQIDHPHALGMVELAAGIIALIQLRLDDAIDRCTQAETIFRDRCVDVWWELATARTMATWSLMHAGRAQELAQRCRALISDAAARNDRYLMANLVACADPFLELLADRPAAAHDRLVEAERLSPQGTFSVQDVAVLFTRGQIFLYAGESAEGWKRYSDAWSRFRRSLQYSNQMARVMLRDLRARIALAAASKWPELARLARVEARGIAGEGASWTRPYADRILAGVADFEGDRALAASRLDAAARGFARHGLALHASACRRRLGQWRGEAEAVDRETALMKGLEIVDPERVTDLYVPRGRR